MHYSTDFVFDGETDRPYVESDRPNPRGVYAASKLLGDWFAADAPRAYVLRVESLFGDPGAGATRRGSLGTIVERIRRGDEVPVFVDRTVSPSYTADIARATRAVLERQLPTGIYHCVNEGFATWAEIAGEAARLLGVSLEDDAADPRLRVAGGAPSALLRDVAGEARRCRRLHASVGGCAGAVSARRSLRPPACRGAARIRAVL